MNNLGGEGRPGRGNQHYTVPREYDIPDDIYSGWRIGSRNYSRNGHGLRGRDDYVVTRPEGYVPYQSVIQRDGRHAYNPNLDRREQYPRTRDEEQNSGRMALLPQARQYEFALNRSDHYVHRPGQEVVMGIDQSQMRIQPMSAAELTQYSRRPASQMRQHRPRPMRGPEVV